MLPNPKQYGTRTTLGLRSHQRSWRRRRRGGLTFPDTVELLRGAPWAALSRATQRKASNLTELLLATRRYLHWGHELSFKERSDNQGGNQEQVPEIPSVLKRAWTVKRRWAATATVAPWAKLWRDSRIAPWSLHKTAARTGSWQHLLWRYLDSKACHPRCQVAIENPQNTSTAFHRAGLLCRGRVEPMHALAISSSTL